MSSSSSSGTSKPHLGIGAALLRAWSPELAKEDADLLWPHRVQLLSKATTVLVPPLAILSVIAWIAVARLPSFVAPSLGALAAASMGVTAAVRVWILLRRQRYKGLDGQLARRAERPLRFWALVGTWAIMAAIYLVGAAYLVSWMVFGWPDF